MFHGADVWKVFSRPRLFYLCMAGLASIYQYVCLNRQIAGGGEPVEGGGLACAGVLSRTRDPTVERERPSTLREIRRLGTPGEGHGEDVEAESLPLPRILFSR